MKRIAAKAIIYGWITLVVVAVIMVTPEILIAALSILSGSIIVAESLCWAFKTLSDPPRPTHHENPEQEEA